MLGIGVWPVRPYVRRNPIVSMTMVASSVDSASADVQIELFADTLPEYTREFLILAKKLEERMKQERRRDLGEIFGRGDVSQQAIGFGFKGEYMFGTKPEFSAAFEPKPGRVFFSTLVQNKMDFGILTAPKHDKVFNPEQDVVIGQVHSGQEFLEKLTKNFENNRIIIDSVQTHFALAEAEAKTGRTWDQIWSEKFPEHHTVQGSQAPPKTEQHRPQESREGKPLRTKFEKFDPKKEGIRDGSGPDRGTRW